MADQTIQYTEEMVGAGHPTKADTLNRHGLIEHGNDGTHTSVASPTAPSRSAGTVYQNTSGRDLFVSVVLNGVTTGELRAILYADAANPPTTARSHAYIRINAAISNHLAQLECVVPDQHYYKVSITAGSVSYWHEFEK